MWYTLLAGVLALASCSSPNPTASPTVAKPVTVAARPLAPAKVFADYLHTSFGHTIPSANEHWYVVIPAMGCVGCAQAELQQLAGTAWSPAVTVVSSGLLRSLTARERTNLAHHVHLLADTLQMANNTLDRLRLPFHTMAGVVHTQAGQVVAFMPIDGDSYQQVFATLPKQTNK